MKTKQIALSLALLMGLNSVALAASTASSGVDESLIDQSVTAKSAEMERTLKQVDALIDAIKKYQTESQSEKSSEFVSAARLMISLFGLAKGFVHVRNVQAQSSIELTLSAVSGALSTLLEKYASTHSVDVADVQALLLQNQELLVTDLQLATNMSDKDAALIQTAIGQIGEMNKEIQSKAADIQKNINNGQVDLAIVSIAAIALHYAAPYLPQKMKKAVEEKAPAFLERLVEVSQAAKTKAQQGLGTTNVATLLSTMVGMAGEDSQNQINTILSNLYATKAQLLKAQPKSKQVTQPQS